MRKWISIYFPLIAILGFGAHSQANSLDNCFVNGNYFLKVTGSSFQPDGLVGDIQTVYGRQSVDWWVFPFGGPRRYRVSGHIGGEQINLDLEFDSLEPRTMYLVGWLKGQPIRWTGYNGFFNGFEHCF